MTTVISQNKRAFALPQAGHKWSYNALSIYSPYSHYIDKVTIDQGTTPGGYYGESKKQPAHKWIKREYRKSGDSPDGGTWVSKAPDFSSRKFSKGQLAHQSRFQEAVAYARHAAKTQPIYAQLAAGTIKSAYNFALSDWFNPPVIHRIESQNGHIRVQASDNVLVTRVSVTILDQEGKVLELGEAIEAEELWWEYVSAAAGTTIVAEARDLAGNVTRGEAEQFQ